LPMELERVRDCDKEKSDREMLQSPLHN